MARRTGFSIMKPISIELAEVTGVPKIHTKLMEGGFGGNLVEISLLENTNLLFQHNGFSLSLNMEDLTVKVMERIKETYAKQNPS